MTVVTVYDAIHDNIGHLPKGQQVAGYSTGAGTHIRWTAADWAAHPGAVRIDQDPSASDPTADVLDVEQGAATPASAPGWAKRATISYATAARPGQRRPVIYVNRSNKTAVANALVSAGIKGGVGLWIADPDMTQAAATAEVAAASGPFPVVGVQHQFAQFYDVSVFSAAWLKEVSVADTAPAKPPVPPGQWKNPDEWTWKDAYQVGIGLDGEFHVFRLENGHWVKIR